MIARSPFVMLASLFFMVPAWPAFAQAPAADPPVLAGDIIQLEVWREGGISGQYQVDQHSLVTLPLVGELDVRGETELSLRAKVRGALQRELVNPSIQLFVLKRIRVIGAVIQSGVFNLGGTMTVADALAMAGGLSPLAEEGKVTLRRDGGAEITDVRESTRLSDLAVRSGDELLVRQRSWIDRNLAAIVTGATAGVGILVALIR